LREGWDFEGGGHSLFQVTICILAYRNWGNSRTPQSEKPVKQVIFELGVSQIRFYANMKHTDGQLDTICP